MLLCVFPTAATVACAVLGGLLVFFGFPAMLFSPVAVCQVDLLRDGEFSSAPRFCKGCAFTDCTHDGS